MSECKPHMAVVLWHESDCKEVLLAFPWCWEWIPGPHTGWISTERKSSIVGPPFINWIIIEHLNFLFHSFYKRWNTSHSGKLFIYLDIISFRPDRHLNITCNKFVFKIPKWQSTWTSASLSTEISIHFSPDEDKRTLIYDFVQLGFSYWFKKKVYTIMNCDKLGQWVCECVMIFCTFDRFQSKSRKKIRFTSKVHRREDYQDWQFRCLWMSVVQWTTRQWDVFFIPPTADGP